MKLPCVFLLVLLFSCNPYVRRVSAQQIGSNVRDARALELLAAGVNAMGGRSSWRMIQKTSINAEISTNGKTASFYWEDDWSNGLKMRRDPLGGNAAKPPSVPSMNTASDGKNSTSRFHPKFDVFNALIAQAPAAAMESVLNNERYSVSLSSSDSQNKEDCVQVSLATKRLEEGGVYTEICLSAESHLPSKATMALATRGNDGRLALETIIFHSFENRQGLLFPTSVSMILPGIKRDFIFTSTKPMSAVSETAVTR